MTKILSGVRVIEVAAWMFVPAAGAVLADLGADVIKIEHPEKGDPQRAWIAPGQDRAKLNKNLMMELGNRGKRSVAIDLSREEGRELLYQLVETADVFLTNSLPSVRQKLGIDVEQIQARNPRILYMRGSGFGPKGPDAASPAYDGNTYWARAATAHALKPAGDVWPLAGTQAFGDLWGSLTIAASILGGLYHRERTGESPVMDVSLLSVGMWGMSPGITATAMYGMDDMPRLRREDSPNPISGYFQSSDGRFVSLSMLQSDRYFRPLCAALDVPELAEDPRFLDSKARAQNRQACRAALDEVFARYTLAELADRLSSQPGPWGTVQTQPELHDDAQALANGYFSDVSDPEGNHWRVVPTPIQYGEQAVGELRPCPAHGEHTDEVLGELGLDWDTILAHKVSGVIL